MKRNGIQIVWILAASLAGSQAAYASGQGPVFGLAMPTNPKGGFSFDTSLMGRYGKGGGTMFRATLGYGITENVKISFSAPAVFQAEPFPPSWFAAFTPMGDDSEALGIWRFHRQDTGVGSRFESAAIGGLLIPGPQQSGGTTRDLHSGPGGLIGVVSGIASRSHYAWVGAVRVNCHQDSCATVRGFLNPSYLERLSCRLNELSQENNCNRDKKVVRSPFLAVGVVISIVVPKFRWLSIEN